MATKAVFTDIGREKIAEFLEKYPTENDGWVDDHSYRIFNYTKWGEGGFVDSGGTDIPRDPSLFTGNTDLEVVQNPGTYSPYTAVSGYFQIDLSAEVAFSSGTVTLTVTAKLESSEFNDDGGGDNPRLFEVGVFDNAGDIPTGDVPDGSAQSGHNMIAYATFDGFLKTSSRTVEVDIEIPFDP